MATKTKKKDKSADKAAEDKKTIMLSVNVKTERDAEKMMKQHIEKFDVDEWHIKLDGTDMASYVYDLKIIKKDWDDIEVVGKGKDDPDGAYIEAVKKQCRHIMKAQVTGG